MSKKKKYHQTGKSFLPLDRLIKAKLPGKRKTRKGKVYYEYRKNRSDMPGKMV